MTAGRLIAVVGPSGVGKDSLMEGIAAADPRFKLVRRVITRAADLGGEDYDAVSVEEFEAAARAGAFSVAWQAHGLRYGIPVAAERDVLNGFQCLANFSRSALVEAAAVFANLTVLSVTAKPETLMQRLSSRGRESAAEISKRLAQAAKPLPEGLDVVTISNDRPLDDTIAAALSVLQPVRG